MAEMRPYVILAGYTVTDQQMEALLATDPGMPIQTHRFAWSLVDALRRGGVDVHLVSTLLASNYPRNRTLHFPTFSFEAHGIRGRTIGFVNLVGIKHLTRLAGLTSAIHDLTKQRGLPLAVLTHGTASPLVGAAVTASRFKRVPVVPVITDIPNWRFSSGRPPASWLRHLDDALTHRLIQSADAVITLTESLASDFAPGLPSLTLEGIAPVELLESESVRRPTYFHGEWINVSYLGSLHEEYGVGALVESIGLVRHENVHLHLFGKGRFSHVIEAHPRVHYHGMVGASDVANALVHSDILVNPRDPGLEFTKYSFPSKLLEYMLSGTPTLATRLPGIPPEYAPLLNWIESPTAAGIARGIDLLVDAPPVDVNARARRAQEFARIDRGPSAQGRRIVEFVSSLP